MAAIEAAGLAGALLRRRFGKVNAVRLKSAKDPVTDVDTAAETLIRRHLARRFPRIGFLGEEGADVAGPDGRWIVDPLDGTIAFVAGLPTFAVSIALEREGRIESGVALFPRLDELFFAERGHGAWLDGVPIRVSARRRLRECVVSLWQDDRVWRDAGLREGVTRVGRAVRSVRSVGAVFSLAYVAAGRLDGYWERSAHAWDLAAGSLLVEEAGGRLSSGTGGPFDIDQPMVLATNGHIHRRLGRLLNAGDGGTT
jgi:myo-inositol-1(or 4)-monophosphatase